MKPILCTCCKSELTAPTIINGFPYGYSCAAKIEGGKQARKFKLIKAEFVKHELTDKGFNYADTYRAGGKLERVYIDSRTGKAARIETINGETFLKVKR